MIRQVLFTLGLGCGPALGWAAAFDAAEQSLREQFRIKLGLAADRVVLLEAVPRLVDPIQAIPTGFSWETELQQAAYARYTLFDEIPLPHATRQGSGLMVWDVLKTVSVHGRPVGASPVVGDAERAAARAVLVAPVDRLARLQGVRGLSEKSDKYKAYEYYAQIHARLQSYEGAQYKYEFDPLFQKYRRLPDAVAAIEREWLEYGYQREVSGALAVLQNEFRAAVTTEWSNWCAQVQDAASPATSGFGVPTLVVTPSVENWNARSGWFRETFTVPGHAGAFALEFKLVTLQRPWLRPEILRAGAAWTWTANSGQPRQPALAEGRLNDEGLPVGQMPLIPETLILCRPFKNAANVPGELLPRVLTAMVNEGEGDRTALIVGWVCWSLNWRVPHE